MKRIVGEWVEKAEGDFGVMERELRGRKSPCFDAVCFHAQQCAEKYMKARLAQFGVPFAKIHSLTALLDQVLPMEPLWEAHRGDWLTCLLTPWRFVIPANPPTVPRRKTL